MENLCLPKNVIQINKCRGKFSKGYGYRFQRPVKKMVVVYLDDITIYFKKRNNHLYDLKKISERCKKYGISLNLKKCFFAFSEGKNLGFIVDEPHHRVITCALIHLLA